LKREIVRLCTFFTKNRIELQQRLMPASAEASARALAKDGFFSPNGYEGVQCVFCRVIVSKSDLNSISDYHFEHSKRSPLCDFILGKPVGNEPLLDAPSALTKMPCNFLPSLMPTSCNKDEPSIKGPFIKFIFVTADYF